MMALSKYLHKINLNKNNIIILLSSLILLFLLASSFTGFVVFSESCCIGPDCIDEKKCVIASNDMSSRASSDYPSEEYPGTVYFNYTPWKSALFVILAISCIGILYYKLKIGKTTISTSKSNNIFARSNNNLNPSKKYPSKRKI